MTDPFPYDYVGGGYYRLKGVPRGEAAETLHGEQVAEWVRARIDRLSDAISRAGACVPCMWQHPEQRDCPQPGAVWLDGDWLCKRHAGAVRATR